MAFEASKIRMRQPARRIGEGKPITPSAAVEIWYRDKLSELSDAMVADYRKEIGKALDTDEAEEFYDSAMDASIASIFRKVLKSLEKKWENIFEGAAATLAPDFVNRAENQATVSTLFSLSAAGINEPKATYSAGIKNTIEATKDWNKTLITNISAESHEKIFNSVMASLTSPDPEKQGQKGIKEALRSIGIENKTRIKLIARDQTSKLYSSISDERMIENGCDEFEWMHSSAGKVPRASHLAKNGQIFKINDPRLWTGPKADQGPPGWAINCRCKKRPII